MKRRDVLGVGFDSLTMNEAVESAMRLIEERGAHYVVTPNPEIVMLARKTPELGKALEGAALVLPDGVGITISASILGRPMAARLPGIDFAGAVMARLAQRGGSVYLFGAKPGVAERAGERLRERFPGLIICGCADGYFEDDAPIIADIKAKAPDLLLVCLGAPKQEFWMRKNEGLPGVGLMIGLGGSLDVFSGDVDRAPESWQKLGIEWLHRLIKEPWRIGRMSKLPFFVIRAMAVRARTELTGGKEGENG